MLLRRILHGRYEMGCANPNRASRAPRMGEAAERGVQDAVRASPRPLFSSRLTQYRHVRAHTNVPVPQVYAYGRASLRHDDPKEQSCYMMMELAAGQPLDAEFFKSPPERRQHFFTDLINILAELRGLEFHAAGSLMPSRPGDMSSDPVVVNAISMPINELYIQGDIPPLRRQWHRLPRLRPSSSPKSTVYSGIRI